MTDAGVSGMWRPTGLESMLVQFLPGCRVWTCGRVSVLEERRVWVWACGGKEGMGGWGGRRGPA